MEMENIAAADRISRLPNDILCFILSLVPFSTAATTTALARRWRRLFHSIPDVYLDCWYSPANVINILNSRDAHINGCIVEVGAQVGDTAAEYHQLVQRLNILQPKVIKLETDDMDTVYTVSALFLSIMTLRRFHVELCRLPVPLGFAGLPQLRALVLYTVTLADGHVERLVSRCPKLEELHIENCKGLHRLAISSDSLVKLDVAYGGRIHILVENAPRLARARIIFEDSTHDVVELEEGAAAAAAAAVEVVRLVNLLRGLSQTQSLHLGLEDEFLQRLKGDPNSFPSDLQLKSLNLKRLHLEMPFSDGYMLCILSCILSSSPNVEDLVIHEVGTGGAAKIEYQDICKGMKCSANWPACDTLSVTIQQPERWLVFIRWLLENRNAVEKMIVSYHWLPLLLKSEAKRKLDNAFRKLKQEYPHVNMEVKTTFREV